ncbi:hypothetical protein IC620_09140 [Hazenella sp. IB182357]|uniref:Carboxymuconolactone decarboxylase family protein n=1 Tax=Polycladospora coralii TaxID=2771432 RepID=A0A926N9V2_9BACL|nr:hypothetical protein [Polycladospora coralii]MBD1372517.1 hypothetical protein [Polycladospora coralii]
MPRIHLTNQVGESQLEKALSYIPDSKAHINALHHQIWNSSIVSQTLKEQIRLFLAHQNGCVRCMSLSYVHLDTTHQELIQQFEQGDYSSLPLGDFIVQYRDNPQLITAKGIEQLRARYSDEQMMEICAWINLIDGLHKMIVSLDLYDFCQVN